MVKIRKIYQITFLAFTFYIFTADISLNKVLVKIFNALHIFPSLGSAFSGAPGGAAWLLITAVLLLLIIFSGRFYCSFLCPLGFLQDMMSFAARFFKIKPRRVYPYNSLRNFILFVTIFMVIFNTGLWGWLDHFSIFGRIINGFVVPVLNYLLSPLSPYLNRTKYFQIDGLAAHFSAFDFYYSILFIIALFILSVFKPRWFCNNLCPSGAAFALINKAGFLKIELNSSCPGCRRCEKNCPAGAIANGIIDYSACIDCFECVSVCPHNKLIITLLHTSHNVPAPANLARRVILTDVVMTAAGVLTAGYLSKFAAAFAGVKKINVSIPPGAKNAHNFFSKCSACHLCISNCPSKVLKPSGFENGIIGLSKPRLDYNKSYCAYECNICGGVCPTGALDYLPIEIKQVTAIGTVILNTKPGTQCIPYKDKVDCGSCAEHCPTGAVYMVRQNDVFVPKVRRAFCNGCGICEHVCPVTDNKPIKVMPLARHIRVRKLSDVQDAAKKSSLPAVKNEMPDISSDKKNAPPKNSGGGFPF